MTTIRSLALVVLLPSVALAQPDVAASRKDPMQVFARDRHGNVNLYSIAYWEDVSASSGKTYSAVERVIRHHLKLRIERADSAMSAVYNTRLITSARFAGHPMSRWLRCGGGLTGDYADIYRITLAYAVFVEPRGDGASRVGLTLYATARNTEGVSTAPVPCSTTGKLESEIITKVREVVQNL